MPDFNSVTNTCTCGHLTEWNIYLPYERPIAEASVKANLDSKIAYVKGLIKVITTNDNGFKMFIATLVRNQLEYDKNFAKELLENTGWVEAFRGEDYGYNAITGKDCREDDTGYLTIWAVSPIDFHTKAREYQKKLEDERAAMDKKPITKEEIEKRQVFPDLRVTDLMKEGHILQNTRVDMRIGDRLNVPIETVIFYMKKIYGVDFNELYKGSVGVQTFRAIKDYHAKWKLGEENVN